MDAVRITDFPTLQTYELRDIIQLQRQEGGVWNDYHTDFGSYFGEYLTQVYEWDLSVAQAEYITCPVGKYLVLLDAHYTYTPGGLFTSTNVQITITPALASTWSYISEFPHVGVGSGNYIGPTLGTGPGFNIYGDMTNDLLVECNGTGSASPNQGTVRITIRYVLFEPV